ncbi:hypothetical protein C8A01DRAFT_50958 [Parachaetomium inaequale]|uniref:Uncharacterized protein n=1 Tax=Parachaetomium inaequale TaxID=2588326 RepID=A0AAN6PA14_9PEZI|nr:hypothetical protein C8A01DRAFT_50958 [Parachaetomium inaequale]
MDQICNFEDTQNIVFCKDILAIVLVVYWPITLDELAALAATLDGACGNFEALAEIVGLCGSFLTLHERTVSFVHQTAKDVLIKGVDIHYTIFSRSLRVMSKTLGCDIYELDAPGFPIDKCGIRVHTRLTTYVTDPKEDTKKDVQDGGSIDTFLREMYLYWLKALSLLKNMFGINVGGLFN